MLSIKRIYYSLLLLSLGLLLVSCHEKKDKPTVQPPVKVEVMEVTPGEVHNQQEYSGTVTSAETTNVSFSVAGTITELYGKEGQKVSKGQLLGKVRSGEYQNAYNIAQAQLAEAQDGYNRLKKLHDANALPDVKWVEMEQKLKQAQNAVEMAQRTLNDANLHSPVSGTITAKYADVGQTVMPIQPVYEIVSTSKLEIEVSVSEKDINNFYIGETAHINLESLGEKTLQGKVSQKAVVADPLTRAFTVKVDLPMGQGDILPGMIGNVKFDNKENHDTADMGISLPPQAVLLNDDNRWFVWIANDSVAERRFVTADYINAEGVIIKSGLNPGDKVIVEGIQKVGTGTRLIY